MGIQKIILKLLDDGRPPVPDWAEMEQEILPGGREGIVYFTDKRTGEEIPGSRVKVAFFPEGYVEAIRQARANREADEQKNYLTGIKGYLSRFFYRS